jgi:hypothetical protein
VISTVGEIELRCIDQLTRPELIETIRGRQAHLPVDLLERLEEQPSDHLRLLLLAGRLIYVLRRLQSPATRDTAVRLSGANDV